jgi:DNA-binding response OmpR family regulator
MIATCPKCAFDLTSLHAVELGDLKIEYDGAIILWKGVRLDLPLPERLILLAMVRAGGAPMKRWVLAEASGYEGDNADNNVAVHLHRMIRAFKAIDPEFDRIENIRATGVRWRG